MGLTVQPGELAQLVERYFCKVDVSGSNPLFSTVVDFGFAL